MNDYKKGQLEPVTLSERATPIVSVREPDEIRICGDYKVTIKDVSKLDNYHILKSEDLYAALACRQEFIKLDLNQTTDLDI